MKTGNVTQGKAWLLHMHGAVGHEKHFVQDCNVMPTVDVLACMQVWPQ